MSEGNGGSGVNALAIVAIVLLVLLAGFFVFRSGMLGSNDTKSIDVNLKVPGVSESAN